MQEHIDPMFINHSAGVLGDTSEGLSGSAIIAATTAYAVEHRVQIPHQEYPFEAGNKRTALRENLRVFPAVIQYEIVRSLCDHPQILERNPTGAKKLKLQLVTRYGHLAPSPMTSEVSEELVEDTRHWLEMFPPVQELYGQALQKYRGGVFERNVLDDLRLALELLLREILANNKSLENQSSSLGAYLKERRGSAEFRNMFMALVRYYANYQNEHVKHNDTVIEDEVEFIIEITSSFMKHLVRMAGT